jgi:hypothetical protein
MYSGLSIAAYADNGLGDSLVTWDIGDVDGYKSNTSEIDEFFGELSQLTPSSSNTMETDLLGCDTANFAHLTNLNIAYNNGYVEVNGILQLNESSYQISSVGSFYKNEITDRAAEVDNLILCEFEDTDEIHFVQIRIDKALLPVNSKRKTNNAVLTITLQLIETEELLQFQEVIPLSLFEELYEMESASQLAGEELDVKILSLYNVRNNLLGAADEINEDLLIESDVITLSTSSLILAAATHIRMEELD